MSSAAQPQVVNQSSMIAARTDSSAKSAASPQRSAQQATSPSPSASGTRSESSPIAWKASSISTPTSQKIHCSQTSMARTMSAQTLGYSSSATTADKSHKSISPARSPSEMSSIDSTQPSSSTKPTTQSLCWVQAHSRSQDQPSAPTSQAGVLSSSTSQDHPPRLILDSSPIHRPHSQPETPPAWTSIPT